MRRRATWGRQPVAGATVSYCNAAPVTEVVLRVAGDVHAVPAPFGASVILDIELCHGHFLQFRASHRTRDDSQISGPPLLRKGPTARASSQLRGGHFRTRLVKCQPADATNFVREATAPYDPLVTRRRGPGLRKASSLPLVEKRTVQMWRSSDYRWRELFESADVMSEGAARAEADGPTYYGTTSVLLPSASRGGHVPDADAAHVLRIIAGDPHARLRAVRIACLEAQLRAGAPIGRVRAELFVSCGFARRAHRCRRGGARLPGGPAQRKRNTRQAQALGSAATPPARRATFLSRCSQR